MKSSCLDGIFVHILIDGFLDPYTRRFHLNGSHDFFFRIETDYQVENVWLLWQRERKFHVRFENISTRHLIFIWGMQYHMLSGPNISLSCIRYSILASLKGEKKPYAFFNSYTNNFSNCLVEKAEEWGAWPLF